MCLFGDSEPPRSRWQRHGREKRYHREDDLPASRPVRHSQHTSSPSYSHKHSHSASTNSSHHRENPTSSKPYHYETKYNSNYSRSPSQRRSSQPQNQGYHRDTRPRTTNGHDDRMNAPQYDHASKHWNSAGGYFPPPANVPHSGARRSLPAVVDHRPRTLETHDPAHNSHHERHSMPPVVVDHRPPAGSYQAKSPLGPPRADGVILKPGQTYWRSPRDTSYVR